MSYMVRWMANRDLPLMVEMEKVSFVHGPKWTMQDYQVTRQEQAINARVCEYEDKAVGGMVYELDERCVYLLHITVDHLADYEKVVTTLVNYLVEHSLGEKRKTIYFRVHERNLNLQIALRAAGWKATKVLRRFCDPDDAFLFRFAYKEGEVKQV